MSLLLLRCLICRQVGVFLQKWGSDEGAKEELKQEKPPLFFWSWSSGNGGATRITLKEKKNTLMVRKRTSTHSMEMVIFPLTTENAANAVSFSFRFSSQVSYWLEINVKILSCSPEICRFWAKHANKVFQGGIRHDRRPWRPDSGPCSSSDLIRCFIFSSMLMKFHHLWQRASFSLTWRASWRSLSR